MTSQCPDVAVLRGLLDSSLPEPVQVEVVGHLDSCVHCQGRLENIASGGSSVLQAARESSADSKPERASAYWPALQQVENEIELAGQGLAVTRAFSRKTNAVDFELAFLHESANPAHLGRLDRFEMIELIGRGGMGMVFRALDDCLQREVAIKILDPRFSKDELARERFLREARAAARVTHENVITIHHVECLKDRDVSFMVMQFVRGKSLQDRLDEGGPLAIREAVRIAASTAAGLASAHATNLIHRDIKPGNILIEQGSGRVLITDFGLARIIEDVRITQTGFVAGTPLYMSPEQARGEVVDFRSDLFSLGGVLFTMLTGVPPFPGSSPFGVLKQVTDKAHRPVQIANPAISNSLAEVVDRLLEKNPRHRYSTATEVAQVLNYELAKLPIQMPLASRAHRSTRSIPRQIRSLSRRYSSPILWGLSALIVLFLLSEAAQLTRWSVLGQRGGTAKTSVVLAAASTPDGESETPTRYTLPPGDGAIWAIAFDPCGELLATATESGSVKFWDAREGHIRGVLNNQMYKSPVWSIAFSKDGALLVTASDDGHVRLWDVKTKQEANIAFKHPFPVRSVAISPDGKRLVSGSRNGTLILWDMDKGTKLFTKSGHEGGVVMAVAFSPDGTLIASAGSDKTVKLWDAEDGNSRALFTQHTGPVYTVAFDSTGERLASAGWDHTVRIWDVKTSEQLNVIDVHKDDIWSLAFCPEGKCLLTGGQDQTAKWLDVTTGEVKAVLRGHGGPVHAVAVAKDGSLIAAGGRDGTVRVWDAGK